MRTSPQHGHDHPRRLLERLDRIAHAVRARGDAVALLGLGSVGRDLHRLDDHSDLDFFLVVDDDAAKAGYLRSPDWLEEAATVAFSFPNTADGRKALFADGVYAEYAVFTVAELREAAYPPARVVWQRDDAPPGLDVPARLPAEEPSDVAHQVGEALTNLLVGLHRELRGERLSAMRLIQVHAVDRVLQVLELTAGSGPGRQDLFARERGAESQHRGRDLPLATMAPGYAANADAARAVLAWLRRHCPQHLPPALVACVDGLLDAAGRRDGARGPGDGAPSVG